MGGEGGAADPGLGGCGACAGAGCWDPRAASGAGHAPRCGPRQGGGRGRGRGHAGAASTGVKRGRVWGRQLGAAAPAASGCATWRTVPPPPQKKKTKKTPPTPTPGSPWLAAAGAVALGAALLEPVAAAAWESRNEGVRGVREVGAGRAADTPLRQAGRAGQPAAGPRCWPRGSGPPPGLATLGSPPPSQPRRSSSKTSRPTSSGGSGRSWRRCGRRARRGRR